MKRRVEELRGHHCGVDGNLAGSGICSAGMLSSAAARSGIAATVVSSRAASRPYSRVTTKHELCARQSDSAAAHAVQSAKGRLLAQRDQF